MNNETEYTVQVVLTIGHEFGPEKDWRDVADAVAAKIEGTRLGAGKTRLVIHRVEIDNAS